MAKKKREPSPDGSVLLTVFHPYLLPHGSLRAEVKNDPEGRRSRWRTMRILQWLRCAGLIVSDLFAHANEHAIIVNVERTDPDVVESAIGRHPWKSFINGGPAAYDLLVAHIYRSTSTSIEHVTKTFHFRTIDIDQWDEFPERDPLKSIKHPYPSVIVPTPDERVAWPKPTKFYQRPTTQAATSADSSLPRDDPSPTQQTEDFLAALERELDLDLSTQGPRAASDSSAGGPNTPQSAASSGTTRGADDTLPAGSGNSEAASLTSAAAGEPTTSKGQLAGTKRRANEDLGDPRQGEVGKSAPPMARKRVRTSPSP